MTTDIHYTEQVALDGAIWKAWFACGYCNGPVRKAYLYCPWCGSEFRT